MRQQFENERSMVIRGLAAGLLVCSAGLGLSSPAIAQMGTGTEPGAAAAAKARSAYVTVTRDGSALRSGASSVWYSVGPLDRGTVLRVDGEEDGWLRVEYPEGIPAVVKPTEGELIRDRNVVRLRRATPLWALDDANPRIENAYKQIFATSPIPAGTELEYLGPVNDNAGNLAGFKVAPPEGALGYILPNDVRTATQEEIASVTPQQDVVEEEATESVEGTDEDAAAPTDDLEADATAGEDAQDARAEDEGAEEVEPIESTEDEPTAEERVLARLAELDAAYRRVLEQPLLEAEFADLIAEYEALKRMVPEESAIADAVTRSADLRIELLEIRAELQAVQRELRDVESAQETASADLERFVEQARRARDYTAIGRLLPSTIYSGDELPRMYRLVSVEGDAMRTVAYVVPVEGIGLEGMVGSIVGVRGDSEAGRSERVQIIRPATAEVLRASE